MANTSKDEPRVLVVGYSPKLKGGVTHATRVLMQNFETMELHPSLYCYSPKYKAVALYLYSVFKFAGRVIFLRKQIPDFVLLIIGSSGDAVRAIPFIWVSCFVKIKLCVQYHSSKDAIFKNFHVTNVTGNTVTGTSKVQLDYSASGIQITVALQAIDISQDVDNDEAGAVNVDVLVRINNHFYKTGTAGLA